MEASQEELSEEQWLSSLREYLYEVMDLRNLEGPSEDDFEYRFLKTGTDGAEQWFKEMYHKDAQICEAAEEFFSKMYSRYNNAKRLGVRWYVVENNQVQAPPFLRVGVVVAWFRDLKSLYSRAFVGVGGTGDELDDFFNVTQNGEALSLDVAKAHFPDVGLSDYRE